MVSSVRQTIRLRIHHDATTKDTKLTKVARQLQIGKDEAVAVDDLADVDVDRLGEHRPGTRKRVELAVLAARVDAGAAGRPAAARRRRGRRTMRSSLRGSTQVSRACSPPSIMSRARSAVGFVFQIGNSGVEPGAGEPLLAIAAHVLEKQIAERHVGEAVGDESVDRRRFMIASYSAFEHGHGSGTTCSGSPAASACASSSSRRTACIATRSNASFVVVSSPAAAPGMLAG